MLFTTLEFLFAFFPLTIIVNFLLPKCARNYWLLLMSLIFYAWGEPVFLFAMLFCIVFNYIAALVINAFKNHDKIKKTVLAVTVVGNLSLLFVYKYMNFITRTIHELFPFSANLFEETRFVLPIGISFFIFQSLSYTIDVYRGVPVQKNPFYVALYVALFPQLIAGPIVRYTTVAEEINQRTVTFDSFGKGIVRFLRGFNKKVLLANILAEVADFAFGAKELTVVLAWFGILCYTLQIFFDFSGYSEMAIGLGLMLGFNFLENFNYPYISKTITEFWRRWHISLGSWFRDYIYFPLGGSRVKSKVRLVFNLFVVWFATGVWHGASWNFILWGVLYGTVITIEKLFSLPEKLPKTKVPAVAYQILTMLLVVFGWVLFRAETLSQATQYLGAMFGIGTSGFVDDTALFYLSNFAVIFLFGILCSTPIFGKLAEKATAKVKHGELICTYSGYVVQFLLFIFGVSFIVMNAHNPFIYFNF